MRPSKTRDGLVVRTGRGVVPGAADTYVAYGKEWANASNTPFRLYKHWVHEGGISSPLIVHWPQAIDPQLNNTLVQDPAHLVDLMATCVDVGRATYPTQVDGEAITPMQGVSLRPAMQGHGAGPPAANFLGTRGKPSDTGRQLEACRQRSPRALGIVQSRSGPYRAQ